MPVSGSASIFHRSERARRGLFLCVTALAAVAVYANTLGNGFVWDDRALILDSNLIRLRTNLGEVFRRDFFHRNEDDLAYGYYRPVTTLSYLTDRALWGVQPFGYHLTNVALHAAATVLVAVILLDLGWATNSSIIAALLFAVHPIHTENVAWIAGRTDLLAFVFSVAALLLRLRAPPPANTDPVRECEDTRRRRRHALLLTLSVAAFATALLAKEAAVIFIAWAVLIDRFARKRSWLRAAGAMAPYGIVLAVYLLVRSAVANVGLPGAPQEHRPLAVLLSSAPTLVRYLTWLLAPLELNAYVQNPYVTSVLDPRFGIAALTLLALAVWLHRLAPRGTAVPLMVAMLLAALLPSLNLIRVTGPADMGNMMAERFCYFPSFPFVALVALAVAASWARLPATGAGRVLLVAMLTAAVVMLSLRTILRNRDWRDELTFLTRTLEQSPGASLLWGNLANYLLDNGDVDGAARALDRAAALDANAHHVLTARARWHVAKGELAEALVQQERLAAHTTLGRAPVVNNLAYLYRLMGETERAREILESLVRAGDGFSDVYFNLGELAYARGDRATAGSYYERALADRPDDLRVARALASLTEEAGDFERAEAVYRSLLEYFPNDPRLLNNLATLRHRSGDPGAALELLHRAIERDPSYTKARINYADLLIQTGRLQEAQAQLRLAEQSALGTVGDDQARTRLISLWAQLSGSEDRRSARTAARLGAPPSAVVLVTVDTLRADFVSAYGYRSATTPYLDRLAARGVLFGAAQAPSSFTAPSMASLFTGRVPSSHGVTNASVTPSGTVMQPVLAPALTTLAERFRQAGFVTIGVPSNVHLSAGLGFDQGFDFYADADFLPASEVNQRVRAALRRAFGADWARTWKTRKTFLWIHYFDPHDPYLARAPRPGARAPVPTALAAGLPMRELKARYPHPTTADGAMLSALYASEVSYFDAQFRRLSTQLGFGEDNVLLVLTADHGEEFAEHGGLGHGHQLFEELIHVPLLVHWPAALAGPRRIDTGVSLLDLYPTLLELAGAPLPEGLHGTSVAPLLRGDADVAVRPLYAELHAPRPMLTALRENHWKLIRAGGANERLQLFNLRDDPQEQRDVAQAHRDVVARLAASMQSLIAGLPSPPADAPPRELSAGVVEQLRALGYVP